MRKIFGTDFYKKIQEQLTTKSNALKLEVADTQKAILAELKLIKTDEEHTIDYEQPLPTLLEVVKSVQKKWGESLQVLSGNIQLLEESIQEHRMSYEAGKHLNEKFNQYEQTLKTVDQLKHYERVIKIKNNKYRLLNLHSLLFQVKTKC